MIIDPTGLVTPYLGEGRAEDKGVPKRSAYLKSFEDVLDRVDI